ncbi:spinocerebellar ataxia type 10 protein [Ditylenchus destructor]|nr:spinocerebellar ataxia type 10 protein [Ditylenchus destructor]
MATDVFSILFGTDDLDIIPLHYFAEFRKFCAVDDHAADFIERVDIGALKRFSLAVLESVLKLLDDFDDLEFSDDAGLRRAKILMQTFVNMTSKSPRFRAVVVCHSVSVTHWMGLLRLEPVRVEVLASLSCVIRDMHKVFYSEETYTQLLSDLATLWNQVTAPLDQKTWIASLFSILLDEDCTFLCECRMSMDRESFTDILFITEHLIEQTSVIVNGDHKAHMIHPGNVHWCVDYLEQMDRDLSILNDYSHMPNMDVGHRLFLLTDIIAGAALIRPIYDECLHNDQRAIRLVCGILKVILDAEDIRRQELEAAFLKRSMALKQMESSAKQQNHIKENAGEPQTVEKDTHKHENDREVDNDGEDGSAQGGHANNQMPHSGNNNQESETRQNRQANEGHSIAECNMEQELNISTGEDNTAQERKDTENDRSLENGILEDSNMASNETKGTLNTTEVEIGDNGEMLSKSGPTSPKQRRFRAEECNMNNKADESLETISQSQNEDDIKCAKGNEEPGCSSRTVSELVVGLKSAVQLRRLLLIRHIPLHIACSLREASMRAIGSLSHDSPSNRLVAGTEMDAVASVLRCALKLETEGPLIMQWALISLKNLCADCVENQEKLLYITEHPNSMLDRNRLLAAIGLRIAEVDEATGLILRLEKAPPVIFPPTAASVASSKNSSNVNQQGNDDDEIPLNGINEDNDGGSDEVNKGLIERIGLGDTKCAMEDQSASDAPPQSFSPRRATQTPESSIATSLHNANSMSVELS